MELRIIDSKPFIVTRAGKKETLHQPGDVVATARQRLEDAQEMTTRLERSTADAQSGLEAALLQGKPTAAFRAELAQIKELLADQAHEIVDAEGDIAMVGQLLEHHRATQIRLADADAIAALLKPFTDFLEIQK